LGCSLLEDLFEAAVEINGSEEMEMTRSHIIHVPGVVVVVVVVVTLESKLSSVNLDVRANVLEVVAFLIRVIFVVRRREVSTSLV
jgi:hypothetical protein